MQLQTAKGSISVQAVDFFSVLAGALFISGLFMQLADAQDELPVRYESQIIKAEIPVASDYFGYGISLDSDTLVVSARGPGLNPRADIYYRISDAWSFHKSVSAEVVPVDGRAPSVAINGDTLLLGHLNHDDPTACGSDNQCDSGLVYVFERNLGGANNWGLKAQLDGGNRPHASFGTTLDIDGDTIAISAPEELIESNPAKYSMHVENTTERAGAVYIFEKSSDGLGRWEFTQRIQAENSRADGLFGHGLVLVGDTMVLSESPGWFDSRLLVYQRSVGEGSSWAFVQSIEFPNGGLGNIAFDGRTLVLSPYDDDKHHVVYHFYEFGQDGLFQLVQTIEGLENSGWLEIDHGQIIERLDNGEDIARLFQKDPKTGLWDIAGSFRLSGEQTLDWVTAFALDSGRMLIGNNASVSEREGEVFAFETAPGINAGHMGGWYNPHTPGQGQLVDVDEANNFLFGAWFSYTLETSDHPYEQHWYTAQGQFAGNKADLVLYETLDGRFDDPTLVSTNPIGTATISFTDCASGMMQYNIDTLGVNGAFPLTRLIPGSETTCESRYEQQPITTDINPGMNGGWFNDLTPGQGFLVDAYPDGVGGGFIFVAWFTYGESNFSGQRWLTAQGNFSGLSAEIDVYEATGGIFDAPLLPQNPRVGSMSFDFTDCDSATLSYELDEGVMGTIPLARLLPAASALCKEFMVED